MSDYIKNTDFTNIFEYPSLPKIHGEPDYKQLKNLKDKLKTNATKIPSELGGGAFSHLGQLLSTTEYANISTTPYVRPIHLGVLEIPLTSIDCVERRRRNKHKRLIDLFHETVNLENALKKQLTEAIDGLYLEELRDSMTYAILSPISFILAHLITNYGEIEPDTVTEIETNVQKLNFTISDPFTKLWKEVKDIKQLSTSGTSSYYQTQLINIALHVIKSANNYQRGLIDWYALPIAG